MSKSILGASLIAFYADDSVWPEDSYQEDTLFLLNGKEVTELPNLSPGDEVKILDGYFYSDDPDVDPVPLKTHYQRWLKKQNTVRLVVECDKSQEAALRAVLANLKVKVN